MTLPAIEVATPRASASLDPSMHTEMARVGLSAGAKPMKSELMPLPVSAVPVLPATVTPDSDAAPPVPDSTTETMASVTSRAVSAEMACPSDLGAVFEIWVPSGESTESTT